MVVIVPAAAAAPSRRDPRHEGVHGDGVGAVARLREPEVLAPREVGVRARASAAGRGEERVERAHGAVQRRVEEESQRGARGGAADDGAVEAAGVAAVRERREGVADVDDEAVGVGPHGAPLAADAHLQAPDAVLVQQRQRGGVPVWARAQRQVRLPARRVVVEPHHGVAAGEEAPQRPPPQPQRRRRHLRHVQRQPHHRVAVRLVVTLDDGWITRWMDELLAEDGDEVVGDGALGSGGVGAVEREGLLPGQHGAEAAGEAAGVAVALAGAALRALLLGEGPRVEGGAAAVRRGEQRRVHAVVHHQEEPVPLARLHHAAREAVAAAAGAQELAEVHHGDVHLLHARRRPLLRRPHELRRDALRPAQHLRVEHHRRHGDLDLDAMMLEEIDDDLDALLLIDCGGYLLLLVAAGQPAIYSGDALCGGSARRVIAGREDHEWLLKLDILVGVVSGGDCIVMAAVKEDGQSSLEIQEL
ncbi:hypothetical protein U9M48_011842 [Paspalum notatum var. saurae]|uniref:Uncharacterized protein n=1 Tax=Paspalum notatum var. saurae TaxID=547442 RepID=A0AAQ3SWB5_PASNO